ncbi:MAG: FtsX-like permease family protein [Gammaproteobacteria bacterium]|nr:FtsX-like permease family protein [Gammaproteobacteria bacterium]
MRRGPALISISNTTATLAWRNLWRHSRRTLLTIAAMVFADTLLVFMLGLQFGQYRMMIDNSLRVFTGQMQVQARGYLDEPHMFRSIPAADKLATSIRNNTRLDAVAVRGYGFALVSSGARTIGAQISGVDPQHEPLVSSIPGLVKQGRYLQGSNSNELVVGSTLARNLKVSPGDELTLLGSGRDGSIAATVAPVVGIFESGNRDLDRQMLSMPLDTFREVFSMGDHAHSIIIGGERSQADSIAAGARAALPADGELVLLSWEKLLPGLKQAIQADFTSAWFMYLVLIVLVAFGVLNTMLMSVLERTHEFGILLALGVRHGRLGRMIITESAVLAAIGLLLGMLAGGMVIWYFRVHGFTYPGMEAMGERFNIPSVLHPEVSLRSLLPGPLAVFIATLLASLYPIWHMRKLRPIEALQTI